MIDAFKALEDLERLCKESHSKSLEGKERGGPRGQGICICSCGHYDGYTSTPACDALTLLKQELKGHNGSYHSRALKRWADEC